MWEDLQTMLGREGTITDGPVSHFRDESGLRVIELYAPRPRLIILGGGHIALALSAMGKLVDFSVVIFDDRPMYANPARFPAADEVICDDFSRAFQRLKIRTADYVVIVTRGHKHDTECLEAVLKGVAPAYTGMIGSRRRVSIVLRQLEESGYDKTLLDQVHTPIGLRIGGVTPAEISVSILAEIIQVKRVERKDEKDLTSNLEIAEWLAAHGDEADALITILCTKGPVPRETGAKMAMTYEGKTVNTIGGGCAESDVMQEARTVIREGGYKLITVDMTDSAEEDGMVCGGEMQVIVESTKRKQG
jgi:xanthine dehydrogenase accessory factor